MSILGYEPEEMIGRSAAEFVYPDDLDDTRRQMRMARRGGVIRNFECRYVGKAGRAGDAGLDGRLVGAGAAALLHRPRHDRAEARRTMRSGRRWRASRRCSTRAMIGIVTLNESGSIETLNPAAERIFGVDARRGGAARHRPPDRSRRPGDISSAARLRHMVAERRRRARTDRAAAPTARPFRSISSWPTCRSASAACSWCSCATSPSASATSG